MTPGLVGFIASGRDEAAWEQSVAAALAALAAEFEVVPERGGEPAPAGRRTLLDTFDWRLYRARLTLEYVARSVGGELQLADHPVTTTTVSAAASIPGADGPATQPVITQPVITQPVTGWQAARPHLMCEVPDGPVASRIGDLVAPRALLPVVVLTTATTTYRLLNSDGKTVARLLVERPVTGGPRSGPRAPLVAPRLSVAEVRGYPGQARRAARVVGAAPGVTSAEVPAFAEALRAIGRRPGDYSNKVDTAITAAMPGQPGGRDDPAPPARHHRRERRRRPRRHRHRVPARPARFGPAHPQRAEAVRRRADRGGRRLAVLTAEEVASFAAEFKWVGDLTTPTRDLDVHLLDFDDTARTLNAAKPDDLEPFRTYLEQRRRRSSAPSPAA